ncbi:MAG: cell division protein ZapA [Zetaproteobacteria bacterium CG12_big_fil_rev_8_21_14_0_65_55_1124]|nr:MAG: cell division protein ZapA [Zetaproteobacteria bacterium CG1_02_55_237]PIS20472.1 MAG: cell division protein ZapA [Zetaproteobacteria bacterium CG08_land_8_20_14_0_20_55_17]PIW43751.1 MAG: cell division protein ZapA [Zetaproteobacteria bacterium CG12_big_fil_rev_8_21_14_0_65_55_1124]PIY53286.1 MAG: cell division protein ZapA [Zetaproteobacteria bacterium CG_4_10_14_0_8_um_filter_55_43]PIZ40141.1 MAG: cell division protein ZapA [Zetaproteobacteria bacterium CG_4_10_14_0_2_um_filter_55_20
MSEVVNITLMGRTFSVRSNDKPEQVEAAAALVQQRIDEIRQLGTTVASDRLLTLVALNLAGELLRGKESQSQDVDGLLEQLDTIVSQAQGLAEAPLR